MADTTHRIEIITNMIDNVSGATRKIKKSIQDMGYGFQKATTQIKGINANGEAYHQTIKQTTKGLHKFNFGWLSVMFAGMALYRVFGSLIKAQMELWGINEMFSATITTVMLPAMETLSAILYPILEWFMNLSPETQKVIGWIILFVGAFGLILMVVGQVALAVGGFMLLWPALSGIIAGVVGVVTASLGLIIIVIIAIIAIGISMYQAWQNNFLGMKTVVDWLWNGIKQAFGGLITFITSIFKMLYGLLTGNTTMFVEGIKGMFTGFWNFLVGGIKASFATIVAIIIGALNLIMNVINTVISAIKWVIDHIGKALGGGSKVAEKGSLGSYQNGGIIPQTGNYTLHKGETVVPAGSNSSGIVINSNYSINVSDKVQMERMIEDNNRKLVSDIRRLVEP